MSSQELWSLHLAARAGDFDAVKTHVEVLGTPINAMDKWNSTPLFYACLGGHTDVITYLLDMGAVCEENTFEGERCLYGALTNEIRNVLRNHKLSKAYRSPYSAFFRHLWETKLHSDFTIEVRGPSSPRVIHLHRAVACARSGYLRQRLTAGDWKGRRRVVCSSLRLHGEALEAVLRFLYIGKLEVSPELFLDVRTVCESLKLPDITARLMRAYESGVRVSGRLYVEDDRTRFGDQFREFFNRLRKTFDPTADLCVLVDGRTYAVHKAFLCARSEHFSVMLSGGFQEGSHCSRAAEQYSNCDDMLPSLYNSLPTVTLHDISSTCFEAIIEFCYTDTVKGLGFNRLAISENCNLTKRLENEETDAQLREAELTFQLVEAAERFLIPGLKSVCASVMAKLVALMPGLVFQTLEAARAFGIERLEDHCFKIFAQHIDEVTKCKEFHDLILKDAASVKARQAVDSIPIVDDIRVHLRHLYDYVPPSSGGAVFDSEAERRHAVLDKVIDQLGLEG